MSPHTWHRRRHHLKLHLVDGRVEHVPVPIEGLLIDTAGSLTEDPAADLMRLDATLHLLARKLRADGEAAATTLIQVHAGRRPRAVDPLLSIEEARSYAATAHGVLVEQLDNVTITAEILREFVIGLGLVDGPLAEAAAGWQRDPAPPAGVEVFLDADLFIADNPDRGQRATWGGTILGGIEPWGTQWRREPDDRPAELEPSGIAGTWSLGYVPATMELYAVHRETRQPRTVWLLGHAFASVDDVADVLAPVLPVMRAPNSLILAAETVRAARRPRLVRPPTSAA
ncbi:hypothetical protein ACFORH_39165 [Amycolatopsis roodepoortensis]|uniref:Uncharacterized protein n=1 Tax=Amycolatopsis roodepoortensis TaxID=700274 RepID=A0ABR9LIY9_9PSEU|nr:hypothetical protein [Amycolatopsis roodepoortensis]MBE1580537.1 hypothetical protein [Amycolatopsis roodepoortensis]